LPSTTVKVFKISAELKRLKEPTMLLARAS